MNIYTSIQISAATLIWMRPCGCGRFSFGLIRYFYRYDCEDMLLECSYAGKNISCCDYVTEVMTNIGKCFRFGDTNTTKKLKKQVIPGSSYGLHILIDIRRNESKRKFNRTYFDSGWRNENYRCSNRCRSNNFHRIWLKTWIDMLQTQT